MVHFVNSKLIEESDKFKKSIISNATSRYYQIVCNFISFKDNKVTYSMYQRRINL